MFELTLERAERLDKILECLLERSVKNNKPYHEGYVHIYLRDIHKLVCPEITIDALKIDLTVAIKYKEKGFSPFFNSGEFQTLLRTDTTGNFLEEGGFKSIFIKEQKERDFKLLIERVQKSVIKVNNLTIINMIIVGIFIVASTIYTVLGYYKDTMQDALQPLQLQIQQLRSLIQKDQQDLNKDTFQVKEVPAKK